MADQTLSQRQRFIVALLVVTLGFCVFVVVPLARNDQSEKINELLARSNARTTTFDQIQDAQREIQAMLLRILAKLDTGGTP